MFGQVLELEGNLQLGSRHRLQAGRRRFGTDVHVVTTIECGTYHRGVRFPDLDCNVVAASCSGTGFRILAAVGSLVASADNN